MNVLQRYIRNNLVAIDQLFNTILGGDEDETISSRAGKGRNKGLRVHTVAANCIDFIFRVFFGEQEHCKNAIEKITHNDAIID